MLSLKKKISDVYLDSKKQKFNRIKKKLDTIDIDYLIENYSDSSLEESIFLFYYEKIKIEHKCVCGKQRPFHSLNRGFNAMCSSSCHAKYNGLAQAGTKYAKAKSLPILTKLCVTCEKLFETKLKKRIACSHSCAQIRNHIMYSKEEKKNISLKRESTCLEKYGDKHVVNSQYTKMKTKEKLGVEYPWQSASIRKGISERYLQKYGVSGPWKNPDVTRKMISTKIMKYGGLDSFNHYKTYVFPSGRTEKVQGYEPIAINELLKTYIEQDIVVGRDAIKSYIGTIKYFSPITERTHYYYPDIYLISESRVIEVKSAWTYEKQKDTNLLKKQSILDRGLAFDFMIY